MSKKPTSERLQLRHIKETNPQDFEHKDYCILFFVDEMKYSLAEMKNLVAENAQVMSTVSLKISGKKYTGTLMFIGSKAECKQRMSALTAASSIENTTPKSACTSSKQREDPIGRDIGNELKKVTKLSAAAATHMKDSDDDESDDDIDDPRECDVEVKTVKRTLNTSTLTSSDDSWRDDVMKKLDNIITKVSRIEDHLKSTNSSQIVADSPCGQVGTPPISKKMRLATEDGLGESYESSSAATPSLMYNETNLLLLSSGGDIKKYALKVLSSLFTTEEMARGIVEPSREKASGKVELDPTRVNLLKRAIKEKFGDAQFVRKWPVIRQSLNQKCLDTKKKICQKAKLKECE